MTRLGVTGLVVTIEMFCIFGGMNTPIHALRTR